jgi:hypothetical protein
LVAALLAPLRHQRPAVYSVRHKTPLPRRPELLGLAARLLLLRLLLLLLLLQRLGSSRMACCSRCQQLMCQSIR